MIGRSTNPLLAVGFALSLLAAKTTAQDDPTDDSTSKDNWAYLQNDELCVGLLKSHGGAIAFLAKSKSDENRLNHFDHGRLIQQSYYGNKDDSNWDKKPWRFNPVQGGDYKGNAAVVEKWEVDHSSAYVQTTPRHWASGKLLDDCTMEQWVTLNEDVVEVKFKFTYNGKTIHSTTHQETPAMFVSPKLTKLVTYSGEHPWSDDKPTELTPGWPNEYIKLTESWAAYVNQNGQGIGVYVPKSKEATCYRYRGGGDSDCSYIAPLQTFALKPGLEFTYNAFFTLGDVQSIRQRFFDLHQAAERPID